LGQRFQLLGLWIAVGAFCGAAWYGVVLLASKAVGWL
jgi:hypothetical protein